MGITRRDFLNGVAITIAAGLTPLQILRASPQTANQTLYYPPALTGLRGNHPGSFEHAHQLGRDGKTLISAACPPLKSSIWWWSAPASAGWRPPASGSS